jgi:colicin import membrane protein
MVFYRPIIKSLFVSMFISALAACAGAQNSNIMSAEAIGHEDDLALASEDYLANLADSDGELDALGLKGKKSTPPSPKKKEAQQRAAQKAKEAKQEAQARRQEAQQKVKQAKKNVQAARKDLQAARKDAQEAKRKAQAARKDAIAAAQKAKKVARAERVKANKTKRQSNLSAALEHKKKVAAMPNKGLLEANAKCDAISEAVSFIKGTNQPPRPFDGKRHNFLVALRAERNKVLRVNGIKDCKSVKAAVASLPPAPTAPVEPADETMAVEDIEDQIPVEVADVIEPAQPSAEEEMAEVEPAIEDPAVAKPEVIQPEEGEVAAIEGAAN